MLPLFKPEEYLKIDVANSFGKDKLTYQERIAWFDENQDRLEELMPEADAPSMYYAGIQAWYAYQAGEPIGYPVSLDCTSSGIQMYCLLTKDRDGAYLCNLIDNEKRNNLYSIIHEKFKEKTGLACEVEYEKLKKAIMTSAYGSEAQPESIFGDKLPVFEEVMSENLPIAWQLNALFLDLWDPKALSYDWVMPDNFHVHIKVMNKKTEVVEFQGKLLQVEYYENLPKKKGRALGANVAHSLDSMIMREMYRRCMFNPSVIQRVKEALNAPVSFFGSSEKNVEMTRTLWKLYEDTGFLSIRILDYIDNATINLVDKNKIKNLIESLPKKAFKILTIHDCFRCHCNYMNDLRKQFNNIAAEICDSHLLKYLLKQISGKDFDLELGDLTGDEVREANYAVC